ncbi:hypothetical protein BDY24DRAFT_433610, partial [Mrakia frigida]|uniref:uncharacterized protein n=1 Tax=Mrakia frigida TaxID=29902 RepID=UPI003FCC046F
MSEAFYSHAHKIYVKSLFKRAVMEAKATLFRRKIEWTRRAAEIRAEFEDARELTDPRTIGAWIREKEKELVVNYSHNPIIHPRMPGGVMYERNTPPPQWTASEWAAAEGYLAGQDVSPWQHHQRQLVKQQSLLNKENYFWDEEKQKVKAEIREHDERERKKIEMEE